MKRKKILTILLFLIGIKIEIQACNLVIGFNNNTSTVLLCADDASNVNYVYQMSQSNSSTEPFTNIALQSNLTQVAINPNISATYFYCMNVVDTSTNTIVCSACNQFAYSVNPVCTFTQSIDNTNNNATFTATDTLNNTYAYIFIVDTNNVLPNQTGAHSATFTSTINDTDMHTVCLKIVDLINQVIICETCTTFTFTPIVPPSPNCAFTYYFSNDTLYTALAGNTVPAQFVWNVNGNLIGGTQLAYYTGNIDSIQVTLNGSTLLGTSCSNTVWCVNPNYIAPCGITTQLTDNVVLLTLNNAPANSTTTWTFGDGTSYFGTIVSHPYSATGTYTICATNTNASGNILCQSCTTIVIANINVNANCNFYSTVVGNNLHVYTNASVPNVVYTWVLSTGDTIVQPTIDLNITNYQALNIDSIYVSLTITYNGYYCTTAAWVQIGAIVLPHCNVNYQYVANNLTAYFIDVTTNYNPTNAQYFWDFGDGFTATTQYAQHTYNVAGTYNVCFMVKDSLANYLCNDSICQMVTVNNNTPNDTCNALFVFTQLQQYSIGIVNMVSGVNPQFTWDFGNGAGSILTGAYPSYTYPQEGSYNICLTVSTNGCTNVFCDSLTVDSLGFINGRFSSTGFTINVVSPEAITNHAPQSLHGPSQPPLRGGGVRCYPNPAKDVLNIEVGAAFSGGIDPLPITIGTQIIITDILGNEVNFGTVTAKVSSVQNSPLMRNLEGLFTINIQHLSRGIYFVKVANETIKFVKE